MPQFDPDPWLAEIVWTLAAFGLLFALMRRFVLPRIGEALEMRARAIREDLEAARRARREAELFREEYERKIRQADEEIREMMRDAERRIRRQQEDAMREWRREMARRKAAFREDLAFARRQAMRELRKAAGEMAVMMAERLIRENLDERQARRMVEEAIARLGRDPERKPTRLN